MNGSLLRNVSSNVSAQSFVHQDDWDRDQDSSDNSRQQGAVKIHITHNITITIYHSLYIMSLNSMQVLVLTPQLFLKDMRQRDEQHRTVRIA